MFVALFLLSTCIIYQLSLYYLQASLANTSPYCIYLWLAEYILLHFINSGGGGAELLYQTNNPTKQTDKHMQEQVDNTHVYQGNAMI
ncbi:hypothetical protein J3E68DRAFT_411264 [Trichoderma sp. SZMC 28012]